MGFSWRATPAEARPVCVFDVATRSVGPLTVPPGAEVIDTTTMNEGQVVDRIVELARGRIGVSPGGVPV